MGTLQGLNKSIGGFTNSLQGFGAGAVIFVADNNNARIQVFDTDGTYSRQFGGFGSADNQLLAAESISIYNSEVYIINGASSYAEIKVFTTGGDYVRKWQSFPADQFKTATDIFVYSGQVYIAYEALIKVFDINGNFLRQWGSAGTGDGEFASFFELDVYNNEVYTTDTFNDRVQVFSLAGTYSRQWGSTGTGDGQFDACRGISVYGGEVFVSDINNERIQVFTTSGTYLRKWSIHEALQVPTGVKVKYGIVYVNTQPDEQIEVTDINGNLIFQFGSPGSGSGEFNAANHTEVI